VRGVTELIRILHTMLASTLERLQNDGSPTDPANASRSGNFPRSMATNVMQRFPRAGPHVTPREYDHRLCLLRHAYPAIGLIALGCTTPQAFSLKETTLDARPFIVGAALQSVDAAGQFVTETPSGLPYPSITAAQAREQALAATRTFGPQIRPYLESNRGAPIDFSVLVAGRTFYGASVYEQTLPADFHPGFRKAAGPYYLVTLLDNGVPVLNVAVSAYNTDVEVSNGRITKMARRSGEDFRIVAVKSGEVPMTPERAAQIAAEFGGVRVARAPRYETPGLRRGIPQTGTWRVTLERAVRVREARAGGQELDVDELAIGKDGVPNGIVPALDTVPRERYLESLSGQWVEFQFRPDAAASFVPLTRAGRN
jgi:hypothetical protein